MPVNTNDSGKKLTDEDLKECLRKLRELLKDNTLLKNIDFSDDYLERFLYGADFDVEETYKRIKLYYELMEKYPEWFPKFGPLEKKTLIDMDLRMAIPCSDREGRPIHIVKLGNVDMNLVTMLDTISLDDIWLESILSANPKCTEKGLCVILDIDNYNWRMIKWATPHNVKISLKKMEVLPFKDYRFHIVNDSFMVHATIKIMWPFLPEFVKKMIKFHFNDRDSLFKHIDPEVLPLEYGGPKEVDYGELYKQLYERNDIITKNFGLYRTIK